MLADESLTCTIKELVHHPVHVWYLVNLPANCHILQTEERIIDQVKICTILNHVHGLVAGLQYSYQSLTNEFPISLCKMCLNVLL